MAKYDSLRSHLESLAGDEMTFRFDTLAGLVGGLPGSAYEHRAWWANTRSHPNGVAWLDAGWEVSSVDFRTQEVVMSRVARPTSPDESVESGRRRPDSAKRTEKVQERVARLIADFPVLLDYYDTELPFDRTGQYSLHRRTIGERRAAGSVVVALGRDAFIRSLYSTLEAWGIGSRASRLIPIEEFAAELQSWSPQLEELDELWIDTPELDVVETADRLWRLIAEVEITENQSKIVALSKTLHHLLPDLIPPIDRMYTQEFFGIHSPEFQYQQERTFRLMWAQFVRIARAVQPAQYVGEGWRTSRSKVIDNAVVAFVHMTNSM